MVQLARKFMLPLPDKLGVSETEQSYAGVAPELVRNFLKNKLKNSDTASDWFERNSIHFPSPASLPVGAVLTSKQQVYDAYFGVQRCGGSNDAVVTALGRVLDELSGELQQDNVLDAERLDLLLTGLDSVLEVVLEP